MPTGLPALKVLVNLPTVVQERVTEYMELLPGLPANNNNVGAIMNFIKSPYLGQLKGHKAEPQNSS